VQKRSADVKRYMKYCFVIFLTFQFPRLASTSAYKVFVFRSNF